MKIQLNFEVNEKVLKQFGIDMDSKTKQELKDWMLASLEDHLENLHDNNRYFGDEKPIYRRRYGLVKAMLADE